jgi:hypothetical protein
VKPADHTTCKHTYSVTDKKRFLEIKIEMSELRMADRAGSGRGSRWGRRLRLVLGGLHNQIVPELLVDLTIMQTEEV